MTPANLNEGDTLSITSSEKHTNGNSSLKQKSSNPTKSNSNSNQIMNSVKTNKRKRVDPSPSNGNTAMAKLKPKQPSTTTTTTTASSIRNHNNKNTSPKNKDDASSYIDNLSDIDDNVSETSTAKNGIADDEQDDDSQDESTKAADDSDANSTTSNASSSNTSSRTKVRNRRQASHKKSSLNPNSNGSSSGNGAAATSYAAKYDAQSLFIARGVASSSGRTRKPIKRYEASCASSDNKVIRAKLENNKLLKEPSSDDDDDDDSASSSGTTKPSRKRKAHFKDSLNIQDAIWTAVKKFDDDHLKRLLAANVGIDLDFTDNDGKTPLLFAAKCSNEDIVEMLVEANANVDKPDNMGRTPVLWASMNGDEEVVEVLLSARANVNLVQDEKGWSPAFLAALKGHQDVLDRLVEANADLNMHTGDGESPLHYAAKYHLNRMADTLIACGADVNSVDKFGESVMWRLKGGEQAKKLFKKLVEQNADVDRQDRNGVSLLEWAVESDRDDLIKFLTDHGAAVNTPSAHSESSLSRAVRKNNFEAVDILLAKGAQLRYSDDSVDSSVVDQLSVTVGDSTTGLMQLAFKNRTWKFVDNLIVKGVPLTFDNADDINTTDDSGLTVTMRAVMRQDSNILGFMIKAKANLNKPDSHGCSPLTWSVKRGHSTMVTQLIEGNADVQVLDAEGKTPLWWASNNGDESMVEALLKAKATTTLSRESDGKDDGKTVSAMSVSKTESTTQLSEVKDGESEVKDGESEVKDGESEVKDITTQASQPKSESITTEDTNNTTDSTSATTTTTMMMTTTTTPPSRPSSTTIAITTPPPPPTTTTPTAKTILKNASPLICAARDGHLNVVKMLIQYGAAVNEKDTDCKTPLLWATENSHPQIVESLLEAEANVNLCDANGETPLWSAIRNKEHDILAQLLTARADVNHNRTTACPSESSAAVDCVEVTPVWCATANDDSRSISACAKEGGSVNLPSADGLTPLQWSLLNNRPKAFRCLLSVGADVNATQKKWETPLWIALNAGDKITVKALLKCGADPNQATNDDAHDSPLLHAGRLKDHNLARTLLSSNADPNLSNRAGLTPLVQAAQLEDVSTLKLLINWRADINKPDCNGVTAVAACTAKSLLQIADTLIDLGADFSKADLTGDTALHKVARDGTGAAARHTIGKLLTANADITAYNNFSQSALDVSQEPIVISTLASWCRGSFPWSKETHHSLSPALRQSVWTMLLIGNRLSKTSSGLHLPKAVWFRVLACVKDNDFFFTPTNQKMGWVMRYSLSYSAEVTLANHWLEILSHSVAIAKEKDTTLIPRDYYVLP